MNRYLIICVPFLMNFAHAVEAPSGFSAEEREQLQRLLVKKERANGDQQLFPPYRQAALDGLLLRQSADQRIPVPEEAKIVILIGDF